MKTTFLTVLLAAAALLPLTSHADIAGRLANQHQRLAAGRASGMVAGTPSQAFANGHNRIATQAATMTKADGGTLSTADTAKLNRELNRRSARIYATKHPLGF